MIEISLTYSKLLCQTNQGKLQASKENTKKRGKKREKKRKEKKKALGKIRGVCLLVRVACCLNYVIVPQSQQVNWHGSFTHRYLVLKYRRACVGVCACVYCMLHLTGILESVEMIWSRELVTRLFCTAPEIPSKLLLSRFCSDSFAHLQYFLRIFCFATSFTNISSSQTNGHT